MEDADDPHSLQPRRSDTLSVGMLPCRIAVSPHGAIAMACGTRVTLFASRPPLAVIPCMELTAEQLRGHATTVQRGGLSSPVAPRVKREVKVEHANDDDNHGDQNGDDGGSDSGLRGTRRIRPINLAWSRSVDAIAVPLSARLAVAFSDGVVTVLSVVAPTLSSLYVEWSTLLRVVTPDVPLARAQVPHLCFLHGRGGAVLAVAKGPKLFVMDVRTALTDAAERRFSEVLAPAGSWTMPPPPPPPPRRVAAATTAVAFEPTAAAVALLPASNHAPIVGVCGAPCRSGRWAMALCGSTGRTSLVAWSLVGRSLGGRAALLLHEEGEKASPPSTTRAAGAGGGLDVVLLSAVKRLAEQPLFRPSVIDAWPGVGGSANHHDTLVMVAGACRIIVWAVPTTAPPHSAGGPHQRSGASPLILLDTPCIPGLCPAPLLVIPLWTLEGRPPTALEGAAVGGAANPPGSAAQLGGGGGARDLGGSSSSLSVLVIGQTMISLVRAREAGDAHVTILAKARTRQPILLPAWQSF